MSTTLKEAPTGADEPDTETPEGKLSEVPRVKVILDETDPTVIKLAFAGGIDLDRTIASDVELFNALKAGKDAELHVTCHVAGAKMTHRRDSEGEVDAVVQTKSLIVHSLDTA